MILLSKRLILPVAVLGAAILVAKPSIWAQGPLPQEGVLLLNNGEVIRGKVTRAGDLFYVAVPGGEIRLPAADVERCYRTLDEAYREKHAAINPADAAAHIQLAEWCLRHDLLGYAGRELADAIQADPTNPMIDPVERRLRMLVEPLPPLVGASADPREPDISPEELDRMVDDLPAGVVEGFTRTVQPLLMNHCGAAGCHGPAPESEFRLLRGPSGQPLSRNMTQRNLHSVLAWVDRTDPVASPLLTNPLRPHGTADRAVFRDTQSSQYQRVADWVAMLSSASSATGKITGPAATQPLTQAGAGELTPFAQTASEPSHQSGTTPNGGRGSEPPNELPSVQWGAELPVFSPVDPFDPEVFNRRYFDAAE